MPHSGHRGHFPIEAVAGYPAAAFWFSGWKGRTIASMPTGAIPVLRTFVLALRRLPVVVKVNDPQTRTPTREVLFGRFL
jgi:hypothetical protein